MKRVLLIVAACLLCDGLRVDAEGAAMAEGQPRQARNGIRPRHTRGAFCRSHLLQQGSGIGRRWGRWRRVRVQLNTMQNKTRTPARSVLAAALALPGLLPGAAQAQVTAPNATLVQFKFLYYKDYQAVGGTTA